MSKIEFENEKHAREFISHIYCACSDRSHGIEKTVENMKNTGYIKKSELQQKVEEAENLLSDFINSWYK